MNLLPPFSETFCLAMIPSLYPASSILPLLLTHSYLYVNMHQKTLEKNLPGSHILLQLWSSSPTSSRGFQIIIVSSSYFLSLQPVILPSSSLLRMLWSTSTFLGKMLIYIDKMSTHDTIFCLYICKERERKIKFY